MKTIHNLGGAVAMGLALPALAAAMPLGAAVDRKPFDFVVGVDGDFKQALAAASQNASPDNRYRIFFPIGEFDVGSLTGNGNQMTTISTSNVSFIGQDMDGTILFNKSEDEGISISSTLNFKGDDIYVQDLTVRNKAPYDVAARASRYVAVMEEGDRFIYKNVRLLSGQDTYYTKGTSRTYWESGAIHGNVDFICGKGDVFFNRCLLYLEEGRSHFITAAATKGTWGYVFRDCTIDGPAGDEYELGRPWSNEPRCVYINTTMKILPSPTAWGDPMNVVPKLFAEYQSKNAAGEAVDLENRRTSYTKDGNTVTINPVLPASRAAEYTIENVLGGGDNWPPDVHAMQVAVTAVHQEGSTLIWDENPEALCWAVFKDNRFYKCVTTASIEIPPGDQSEYSVRAANAMGGLGPAGKVGETSTALIHAWSKTNALFEVRSARKPFTVGFHAAGHRTLRIQAKNLGNVKLGIFNPAGREIYARRFTPTSADGVLAPLEGMRAGRYMFRIEREGRMRAGYLDLR